MLKRFKDTLAAAGLRRLRFHDLRHTFGTQMAAAGVPMRTLQEWLGHRSITTTMVYADYQASDQERELVEVVAGSSPVAHPSRCDLDVLKGGSAGLEKLRI